MSVQFLIFLISLSYCWGLEKCASAQCSFDSKPREFARQNSYEPMTHHDRLCAYVRESYTTPGFAIRTFGAGLGQQLGTKPPEWDSGANGYFHRTGLEFGRFTMQGTIQSSMAAGLHQDTRYIRALAATSLRERFTPSREPSLRTGTTDNGS